MSKIPFHIISGFLGSGKTTFLSRIIRKHSAETRMGIIQNEFAPSNVDGAQLNHLDSEFDLLEINNGSVFCVCLLGDFVRSLDNFIEKYRPDIIIIEASGLSDTTSIAEVLSAGSIKEKIYLASNWCIVDAKNFSRAGLMKERVMHQLRMADVVVVNKTDQVKNGIDNIVEEIKRTNPFAEIIQSVYCNIDYDLGNPSVDKFYMGSVKSLPRPAEVNSMVIKSGREISREALERFLNQWAPAAYRIKGYVRLKRGNTAAVQCTYDNIEIIELKNDLHPTELVALSTEFTLREWNNSFKQSGQ